MHPNDEFRKRNKRVFEVTGVVFRGTVSITQVARIPKSLVQTFDTQAMWRTCDAFCNHRYKQHTTLHVATIFCNHLETFVASQKTQHIASLTMLLLCIVSSCKVYPSQTKILEGQKNLSECTFKCVSTWFWLRNVEKCFENAFCVRSAFRHLRLGSMKLLQVIVASQKNQHIACYALLLASCTPHWKVLRTLNRNTHLLGSSYSAFGAHKLRLDVHLCSL